MCFAKFLADLYGGEYKVTTNSFGHKILVINVDEDVFKINLTDKTRFGQYDLYHRNSGRNLQGNYNYHRQGQFYSLSFAMYLAWTHKFNKDLGIPYNKEDYERLMSDYKKSLEPKYE